MRVAICVDKSGGIAFGGKRQSRDRVLNQKLLALLQEGEFLYINSYSAPLFEPSQNIVCCEDYLAVAKSNDICFTEAQDLDHTIIDELILFCWNRQYPADMFFLFNEKEFEKISTENFEGSSHKKITMTIYRRNIK